MTQLIVVNPEAFHEAQAFTASPSPTVTGGRATDGVRENRGAGAGWVAPSCWMNTSRATMCGCFVASDIVSTGAKQTSVPSMIADHSSRLLVLNPAVSLSLSAGQFAASM